MISRSPLCIFVATIALVSTSLGAHSGPVEEELPAVTVDYNGQRVSVPYYENREPVSEEKKKYDRRVINEISLIVQDMVRDALLGKDNFFKATKKMTSHGLRLLKTCSDNKAWLEQERIKNAELGRATKQGYMANMGGLVQDIFEYDVCSAKKIPKPAQPDWCQNKKPSEEERMKHVMQITEYLNMFRKIVDESPLGSYVDWRKMTIDDKTVVQAFGEEVSFFRRCGYSTIITILGWLSSSMKKM